jgi:3-oxoacyl-[acyl-carrier-protein] synthase II
MAVDDAGLTITDENGDRVGVITGCGLGGLRFMEDTILTIHRNGPKRVSPFFIPMMIGNMAPGMISILFGAKGPTPRWRPPARSPPWAIRSRSSRRVGLMP